MYTITTSIVRVLSAEGARGREGEMAGVRGGEGARR